MWGVTVAYNKNILEMDISTHTPRVGRDTGNWFIGTVDTNFNSHAPCGA